MGQKPDCCGLSGRGGNGAHESGDFCIKLRCEDEDRGEREREGKKRGREEGRGEDRRQHTEEGSRISQRWVDQRELECV